MRLSLLLTTAPALPAAPVAGPASRWCDQSRRAGYETRERARVFPSASVADLPFLCGSWRLRRVAP